MTQQTNLDLNGNSAIQSAMAFDSKVTPTTKQEIEFTTPIFKNGHHGKSMSCYALNVGGYDYKISASKGYRGGLTCSAQKGKRGTAENSNFDTFQCSPLEHPSIELSSKQTRATEKQIREVFAEGLEAFKNDPQFIAEAAKEVYQIEEGQKFKYISSHRGDQLLICYQIKSSQFGTTYKLVNPETLEFNTTENPRPIEEKFGIGIYYLKDEKMNVAQLAPIVEQATDKQNKFEAEKKRINETATIKRTQDIEKGSELLPSIPSWAKGMIVASLHEDASDPYTDYCATSTVKTVYLAFSTSKRANFNQMIQAAAKAHDIPQLIELSKDAEVHDWPSYTVYKKDKANHYSSGWRIQKVHLDSSQTTLEKLQIAAANGLTYFDQENKTAPDQNIETNNSFEIRETTHTKTGAPLFVATLKNRISQDEFRALKTKAKEENGFYSRYTKGFTFHTIEDAQSFINHFNSPTDPETEKAP